MIKWATLKVSGLAVQHVGFRDAVERVANELGVVGTIENLEDGSVKIVCEGKANV